MTSFSKTTKVPDFSGVRARVAQLGALPVNPKPLLPTVDADIWPSFADTKQAPLVRVHSGTNAELQARREQVVPRGIASATAIYAERAENAFLWDQEGRRFIDFGGGIGVQNTGHRNPRVMARAEAQAKRLIHPAFQVTGYESYVQLCEDLAARAPVRGPAKVGLFSTGAEAVENAVKIARAATGRSAVIAFQGAFHGRTMMGMALTGKVAPYKIGFGPLPGEVYHAPFPSPYRGVSEKQALDGIKQLFKADLDPKRVAAIILEPVQGEGGFHVASPSFFHALRQLCDDHGILLIADEVQSGFGRTGKLFALEHSGVQADLLTTAKSLGGGYPLSGVIGNAGVMDAAAPGGLGGTYGGNPVACEAALGVLDAIYEDGLLARGVELGERMRTRLEAMQRDIPLVGDVRGLGPMLAIELTKANGEPATAETKTVVEQARKDGLLVLSCGVDANVLRFLLPLTAPFEVVDAGLDILERALESVA